MSAPLIDTARVRFSGLSTEAFEIPSIGETVTYTIKATCTTHTEQDMANEGTRRTVTMKVDRVVEGVSEKVHDGIDGQITLEDSMADVPADEDEGDEDTNVVDFVGPTFSGADNG